MPIQSRLQEHESDKVVSGDGCGVPLKASKKGAFCRGVSTPYIPVFFQYPQTATFFSVVLNLRFFKYLSWREHRMSTEGHGAALTWCS